MKIQGAILHLRFFTKLPSFLVVAGIMLNWYVHAHKNTMLSSNTHQMKSKSTVIHQWHYFILAYRLARNPPIVC